MYSSGGTDGRDHGPDSSPPWVEQARDRRQHQRKFIDLTTCPEPRRHRIAGWDIHLVGGPMNMTDLFICVRDKVFELLRQRNLDEDQRREAAQVLRRASKIRIDRYYRAGWMFTWGEGGIYYLVIRERDPLTKRLDCEQPPFQVELRTAI